MFKQIPAVSVSMRKIERSHFPAACRAHRACLMPLNCCGGWWTESHTWEYCPLSFLNGEEKGKMKNIDPMSPVTEPAFEWPLKVPSSPYETELNRGVTQAASVFLTDHLTSPSVWASFSPPGWLAFAHHILSSASPRRNQVPFWG